MVEPRKQEPIAIKNVRNQLTKNGIDPDTLIPEQVWPIAVSSVHAGQVIRSGRTKFDSYEFPEGFVYRVRVVSGYLRKEPLDQTYVEFAHLLLGEKTADELHEEMKHSQAK